MLKSIRHIFERSDTFRRTFSKRENAEVAFISPIRDSQPPHAVSALPSPVRPSYSTAGTDVLCQNGFHFGEVFSSRVSYDFSPF